MLTPNRRNVQLLHRRQWWRLAGMALMFMFPLLSIGVSSPQRLVFNLPADSAQYSLMEFSVQSGKEVVFATQAMAGVTTHSVQGEYTAKEAVDVMLADTGYEVVQNESNGVLTVRKITPNPMNNITIITKFRRMLAGLLLAFTAQQSVSAQEIENRNAVPETPAQANGDEVVTMSAFTVSTTQGKGYLANDAVSGLKSKQALINIPQSIQVIPRDVIEDLGQFNSTIDTIKYMSSGVVPYGYGEIVMMRGFRSGGPLIDGQAEAIVMADPVSYDSYEVLKGPAAVLYGQRTDLSGIIIKHTKKPLSVDRRSVRVMVGDGDFYRAEVDLTGPLGTLGSVPVSYRVIVAKQEFGGFQPVDFDDRTVFAGGLKFEFNKDTSLLVQADYVDATNKGISNNFRNEANDDYYRGEGYNQGYKSSWSSANFKRAWLKATLTHRYSPNWESVTAITGNFYDRKDREVRNAGSPNFATNTIPQYFFGWDYQEDVVSFQSDITGNYQIAGLKNQSSFGFSADRGRALGRFWLPGSIGPNFITSITNPDSYNVAMPDYTYANSNDPTRNQRVNAYAYYAHTLELIEDKLSVVAGLSTAYLNTNDKNLTTGSSQDLVTDGYPRRLGIVFKPVKDVALFVNNSTAFRAQGARNAAGDLFPPVEGEVLEGGFKTSLQDGRISSTFTYFKLDVSNLPLTDPNDIRFSIPAGTQTNQGFELDVGFRPIDDWSIVGSLYSGDIKGTDGARLPQSINKSASLLTKYDFSSQALKGLSLGASMFHAGDRLGAPWNAYTVYGFFAGYTRGSWDIRLNVDNVTDEKYSSSGWGDFYMDVAASRNAKLTFSYRF